LASQKERDSGARSYRISRISVEQLARSGRTD